MLRIRQGLWGIVLIVSLALIAGAASGDDWVLVFEDDFERAEAGPDYVLSGADDEAAMRIVDGELTLTGGRFTVHIARPFAMDLRLEFDGRVGDAGSPCGLAALLNAPRTGGDTYRFYFGGHYNTANVLQGPGIQGLRDDHPAIAFDPAKTYRMRAEREGNRIRYQADGQTLLETRSDSLAGGSAFDRAGFLICGSLVIDNVRVYERRPPHPRTRRYLDAMPALPLVRDGLRVRAADGVTGEGLDAALDALNGGDYETARERFAALDDATLRLVGLAYVLGDINYFEKPVYGERGPAPDFGEFGAFAETWAREAEAHPDAAVLREMLPAVRSFGRLAFQRASRSDARTLVELGPDHNPFYYKARLFLARYTYYDAAEAGSPEGRQQALDWMQELKDLWPENLVLREYLGPPVPWGDEFLADTERHPAWAAYLREAYARQVAILNTFCRERQMADGQMGGGWGDDVEMLRTWVSVAAISNAATELQQGIDRLCEGIWTHVTVDGYDPFPGDVEHSAEPSADSFPTQLLLHHGDPLYHQWNLASCRTLLRVALGIDEKGYPRFKSVCMGTDGIRTDLACGGDTGYHARAMKHFYWLAWYGNKEAEQWYLDWADGWRNAILLDRPDKPAGVVPPTLWYPSGDYNPPNGVPWYHEDAHNYYGVHGLPDMIYDVLLAAYSLSGDRKFLRPYQRMMDFATWGPLVRGETTPGTREWFLASLAHQSTPRSTALYRMLTGESVYDEYTRRFGTVPQTYPIDRDLAGYLEQCEKAATSLRTNLRILTTETMATDRYQLPAMDTVWGAYTGAIQGTRDARVPLMAVTYDFPSTDFAAVVTENHPERVRLLFYSFRDEPTEAGLRLWRLTPGEYLLNHGRVEPGERDFQRRYDWGDPQRVRIVHKGDTVRVLIPPGEEYAIDLRLDRAIDLPDRAPDLAVHSRDIQRSRNAVTAVLYNLGSAEAADVEVRLERFVDPAWQLVSSTTVPHIPPPVDFTLAPVNLVLPNTEPAHADPLRIVVDPERLIHEICETNNLATVPDLP